MTRARVKVETITYLTTVGVREERQEWQLALGSLGTGLSRMVLAAAGSKARVGAADVI